jgi:hypothetical protein
MVRIGTCVVTVFLIATAGVVRRAQAGSADRASASNDTLPFLVTVYYHVEPNKQLFESVEPGYFECVSSCLREMSMDLAAINVDATFCFAWLYNDIVYQRNHDPVTLDVVNGPSDTGIETFEQIVGDGHELAYHAHPPMAIVVDDSVPHYARPDSACLWFDTVHMHRWRGYLADYYMDFFPGVYEFDDPADDWFGHFTWERASENLFRIADYLGVDVRHANGGQRPLLDLTDQYGSGINHPHCIAQIGSLVDRGFDLIAPECMPFFNAEYSPEGTFWSDTSTYYVAYFGPETNGQVYYPDIDGVHLEHAAGTCQGLTFMPVQREPQAAWMSSGVPDTAYYDPEPLGTGGGGRRWTNGTFFDRYYGSCKHPWVDSTYTISLPSLAAQFNTAINRHLAESPTSANAWGLDHHVVNVMWADLSGLSDNWDRELIFLQDIADGAADGVINPPRPDLVQFVTMQRLSQIHSDVVACEDSPYHGLPASFTLSQNSPNPFSQATFIRYTLPELGAMSLAVYNLRGQLVRALASGTRGSGVHTATWNADTELGGRAETGTYICRLCGSGSESVSRRMRLVR